MDSESFPMVLDQKIALHLDIILRCAIKTEKGIALMATLPDSRYPYVYPRDSACASQLLLGLSELDIADSDKAFSLLEGLARFISSVQKEDGFWGQRYGLGGEDKSIYKQEDNVAHGATILGNYLLTCSKRNCEPREAPKYLSQIKKAVSFALKNYYRKEINLFFSTTSLHESAIEKGYSIWVNHAYSRMLNSVLQVAEVYGVKGIFDEELKFKQGFCNNIHRLFIHGDRYIRRLTPQGFIDFRPDVTLLSPYYFKCRYHKCPRCMVEENSEKLDNTIAFVKNSLWDPELGMLQRYLPFTEDIDTHVHAGNGPWIAYTAILAQYYYENGKKEKGDEIVNFVDQYKTKEGYFPEHLTTPERFTEFIEMEWQTGLDAKKEFHPEILLDNLPYDRIVEEIFNMKNSYNRIRKEVNGKIVFKLKSIHFAQPLMWAHAEYAKALLIKKATSFCHGKNGGDKGAIIKGINHLEKDRMVL